MDRPLARTPGCPVHQPSVGQASPCPWSLRPIFAPKLSVRSEVHRRSSLRESTPTFGFEWLSASRPAVERSMSSGWTDNPDRSLDASIPRPAPTGRPRPTNGAQPHRGRCRGIATCTIDGATRRDHGDGRGRRASAMRATALRPPPLFTTAPTRQPSFSGASNPSVKISSRLRHTDTSPSTSAWMPRTV